MTAVLTDLGAALMAQQFAAMGTVDIDSVRIGSVSQASERYDATAAIASAAGRTQGLLDATPRIIPMTGISLFANMGQVQIDFGDSDATAAYAADEIAVMSGTTPVFLIAQASGPYYTKVANASALFSLGFDIGGAAAASVSVTVPQYVFATSAEAETGTAQNRVINPARLREQMTGTVRFPREIPNGTNLDVLDNPDHFGVWYKTDITTLTGKPPGIGSGEAVLEITQSGEHTSTVTHTLQRLTISYNDEIRVFIRDSRPGHDAWRPWQEQISISYRASQTDAEAGTNNLRWMTPLRTADAIRAFGQPAGTILDFGGTAAPAGYLLCDGGAVSRTTYADLFAAIGTNWGSGDGSTTFNVPDLRRRVTVGSGGVGSTELANTVGSEGGEETHRLTEQEMPSHHHTYIRSQFGITRNTARGNNIFTQTPTTTDTSDAGGGQAHNIMQPSAVVTKIIKT